MQQPRSTKGTLSGAPAPVQQHTSGLFIPAEWAYTGPMAEFADEYVESGSSWLSRRVEEAFRFALTRAYESSKVQPEAFLEQLQRAYGVEAESYDELFSLPLDELDSIAQHALRSSMKLAGAEGAGLGLGGFATVVPDMGILAMITMRTVQKLSLIYGFQYNTDEEVAELWIAAGTAAGVDLGKDLLERTVLKSLAERVVGRMAARFSAEFADKMVARTVPILSSAVGGLLNYYFVRAWGNRALKHFRERHLEERSRRARGPLLHGAPPLLNE